LLETHILIWAMDDPTKLLRPAFLKTHTAA
jgi:hypothetical protein